MVYFRKLIKYKKGKQNILILQKPTYSQNLMYLWFAYLVLFLEFIVIHFIFL